MDIIEQKDLLTNNTLVCEPLDTFRLPSFVMIIFGGAGDLAQRKLLPALYHLCDDSKNNNFFILGFGKPAFSNFKYRELVRKAVSGNKEDTFVKNNYKKFSSRLFYISSSFDDDRGYKNLKERIKEISQKYRIKEVIYYLATPPQFVKVILKKLKKHRLNTTSFHSRIIVEKPFGHDRKSAVSLNQFLKSIFRERQIYRIDHYLAKQTVIDIMFFRFSNSIFEPLWRREYIDHIQITVAETLGVEQRGVFYEKAGVIRDIVQNHIMQLIALVAMEPPVGFDADLIRNEKVKVFRSIKIMRDEEIENCTCLGQYGQGKINSKKVPAYRDEKNVAKDSRTSTFFAAKFFIDNWRWAGVPIYIRTGKRLKKHLTQIVIQFKKPPLKLLGSACDVLEPNILTLSIQPQEKISLKFGVRNPRTINMLHQVNMNFDYHKTFKMEDFSAYERLIIDCIKDDPTLFVRDDGIEAMWGVVDPIINYWQKKIDLSFPNYPAGSWGPPQADELIRRDGREWIN